MGSIKNKETTMLLIQNETTEFVKEKLSSFCKKTSEGLSKPKQKFIKDMLMGLCGTGSPSVHNISKFIQDNVSTKSYSERLYRNLSHNDYVEHIDKTFLKLVKPYITDDLIPEIYAIGRVTHWNANAVFSDKKIPALQQEHIGRICCSEKT